MDKLIPRFNIEQLNENEEIVKEVFFTNKKLNSLKEILNKPYRSNYYGIGLCISGKATLIANLEKYEIEKNTIISMSPHVIKQWAYASEDYQTLSVFFTKSYISKIENNVNVIEAANLILSIFGFQLLFSLFKYSKTNFQLYLMEIINWTIIFKASNPIIIFEIKLVFIITIVFQELS